MQPNRKTLLEQALDQYDLLASKHFTQLKTFESCPEEKHGIYEKELKKAREHLDNQRVCAETMASIQAKLDDYRDKGRLVNTGTREQRKNVLSMMRTEKHHPAYRLAQHLIADGKAKPSPNHSAHHIVPGKGKVQETYRARTHMHIHSIRINDPDNGVWLPTYKKHTPHWSMPAAMGHLEYHTHKYEYKVAQRIRLKTTEAHIRTELNIIGKQMQLNAFTVRDEL